MKNEKGFTLVEMLVVLMIISILLLIAIPNMSRNNEVAADKGCEATVKLVQAQVYSYKFEKKSYPDNLSKLYPDFVDRYECPDGSSLNYNKESGQVSK
ncbi:late competence protein [Halalkalibacter wakoensis JCM 9140]|uniref:ComG operon protein 3 n=1 Tax=Halalkalibacter wakoensis JCM 9140 TaxID=1236970 RepID=W4QAQ5_9BACI|nr:competence type IV pilus major pilin ComGC [Halalkalibacter wakoensis]GAE28444.1 late competence protein [Halalkalibacter wakoensis JCM 9140]